MSEEKNMTANGENETREVHIHLGDLGPGVTHVHVYVGAAGNGKPATVAGVIAGPTAEDSLARLKAWDPASAEHIQAAYDGLARLGCVPNPAGSRNRQQGGYVQPYIRWEHPDHGTLGYLNAATLTFARKNDVPLVRDMPGAVPGGPDEVRFPVTSREGVKQALAAARRILGSN
jgi:hypothetical protein